MKVHNMCNKTVNVGTWYERHNFHTCIYWICKSHGIKRRAKSNMGYIKQNTPSVSLCL